MAPHGPHLDMPLLSQASQICHMPVFKAILFKSEPAVRVFFFSSYFSVQTLLYTEETHGTEGLLT